MRSTEFIIEGRNHPVIVVDVQPAFDGDFARGEGANPLFVRIIEFVNKQTGPVLMFVNAEETGLSDDSIVDIQQYWNDTVCHYTDEEDRYVYNDETDEYDTAECEDEIDWGRFTIDDKGYGYFRTWMDAGVDESAIIKVIRLLYQNNFTDSRQLFNGEDDENYIANMVALGIPEHLLDDALSVEWTSVVQLKRFNGAYIVGGGRTECLREVELLMNAFNIRYKRIDSLVYG